MNDVSARSRVAAGANDHVDRCVLRGLGARGEERGVGARIARERTSRLFERSRELRVHEERRADVGQNPHRDRELGLVHVGKLGHSRVGQETLEREHPFTEEVSELLRVLRHCAAGEAHVDVGATFERARLGVERRNRHGGRQAVERHVAHHRDPALRRRAGGRLEALPRVASGIVDVHVRVDDAGHDDEIARVEHLRAGGHRRYREHRANLPVGDVDSPRLHRLAGDDTLTCDVEIAQGPHFRARTREGSSETSRASSRDRRGASRDGRRRDGSFGAPASPR